MTASRSPSAIARGRSLAEKIGRLANRTYDVVDRRGLLPRCYREDLVPGVVERRAQQVVHRSIDDCKVSCLPAFKVFDAGEQHAGVAHQRAAGFDEECAACVDPCAQTVFGHSPPLQGVVRPGSESQARRRYRYAEAAFRFRPASPQTPVPCLSRRQRARSR